MLQSLSQFDFHHRLADLGGVSLVAFSSRACGSCRHLGGVLEQVSVLRSDWHIFTVDAEADTALIHEFEVFHLPTMALFTDGHYHAEINAKADVESIIDAIEHSLRQEAQDAP